MLKNLSLKNSLISSVFGISMLTSLIGCGQDVSTKDVFNDMTDCGYSVVQLKNTQFEILSEYKTLIKYDGDTSCAYDDTTDDVHVHVAENTSLCFNSKSKDDSILEKLNMYFIDDKMTFTSNAPSVRYEDKFRKINFEDLTIDKDGTIYHGKLSIVNYGNYETFILVYAHDLNSIDASYMIKSLKNLDDKKNLMVVDAYPSEPIDTLDYTYNDYLEKVKIEEEEKASKEKIEVVDNSITEESANKLLQTTKTFNGSFYKLVGFYGLEKNIDYSDISDSRVLYEYLNDTGSFSIDLINMNGYGSYKYNTNTSDEKINITKEIMNVGDKDSALNNYEIAVSKKVYEELFGEYDVDIKNIRKETKSYNGINWFIIYNDNEFDIDGRGKSKYCYALTMDENNHVYAISFVYHPSFNKVIDKTLSNIDLTQLSGSTLSAQQELFVKNIY